MSHDSFSIVLLEMYETQKYCNVKFICADPSDSSGKSSIQAHKLILSMNSDVFEAMFYGALNDGKSDIMKTGIEIPDINITIFKLMLSFIYGKEINLENVQTACDFYYAVQKYNCKDGLKIVTSYLLKEMNPANVIFIFESTENYNNSELKAACLEKFSNHTLEILRSDQFLEAQPETLQVIFELDNLTIDSEADLIVALERYVEKHEKEDPEIRSKIRPALNNIRFLALPAKKIIQTSLLTPEEMICVIKDSNNLSWTTGTKSFSQNRNQRNSMNRIKMIHTLSDVLPELAFDAHKMAEIQSMRFGFAIYHHRIRKQLY